MNNKQQQLLIKMKKLIREGKRKFSDRKDRDIIKDLLELDLTVDDAWNIILGLNQNFYYIDTKPFYLQSNNSLTFKRKIKEKDVYIKLLLEKDINGEIVVCLSFHKDYKRVI